MVTEKKKMFMYIVLCTKISTASTPITLLHTLPSVRAPGGGGGGGGGSVSRVYFKNGCMPRVTSTKSVSLCH